MPHSFGYRAATRTLFKKPFKTNGRCPTTTYLRTFKRGDYVDIKVDSSIHKGMPFKHYHGRTGVVFNVNKRAVGVTVNKQVNGRIIRKNLHIAMPHLKPSKCQQQIIARKQQNEAIKADVRKNNKPKVDLKRKNTQPKEGYFFKIAAEPTTIRPLKYVDLY